MKNQVHISTHPKGWKAQTTGKTKPFIVKTTKAEVMPKAIVVAKKIGAELIPHKKDGTIQKTPNSYGNDPKKSKG
jgi:adenine/guanine phosphoribosyltransferase-like PRPP-binding protein